MAEKRMISIQMVDDDAFLDMGPGAQLLYFHLVLRADDDGFLTPKKIMRAVGAKPSSLKELVRCGFVYEFDSGVICIRHWLAHNAVRKDCYTPSVYPEREMVDAVTVNGRKEYRLKERNEAVTDSALEGLEERNGNVTTSLRERDGNGTESAQERNEAVTESLPKERTGKNSLSKEERVCLLRRQDKKEETELANNVSVNCPKPTLGEVIEFVRANGLDVDADEFLRACERDGWRYGGKPIWDWKALIRSWSRTGVASRQKTAGKVLGGGGDGEELPYGSYRL